MSLDEFEEAEDRRYKLRTGVMAGVALLLIVGGFLLLFGYFHRQINHQDSMIGDLRTSAAKNADQAKANASALNKANDRLASKGDPTVVASPVPGAQGQTGAQGPRGPRGATGPTGPAGKNGADGKDGKDGSPGPAGSPGPRGPKGDTGKTGANGSDGQNGADGSNGKNGAKGDTGATGADGANGADGAVGPPGPQGPKGDTGPAGKDGQDGQDGADGVDGQDGRGIKSVTCTTDGTWLITYTDDTTQTADGPCRVEPSAPETSPSSDDSPSSTATADQPAVTVGSKK